MLKQEYKPEDNLDLKKSLALAIKVLSKTLDMTKVTPEKSKYRCGIVNELKLMAVSERVNSLLVNG